MAYAYQDQFNIIHIVEDKETAEKYHGKGAVVYTGYPHENGYPAKDGKQICIYTDLKEAYIGGSHPPKGKPYDYMSDNPLKELVDQITGA